MKINNINDSVFKNPGHTIVAMLYNWYLRQDESLRIGGGGISYKITRPFGMNTHAGNVNTELYTYNIELQYTIIYIELYYATACIIYT